MINPKKTIAPLNIEELITSIEKEWETKDSIFLSENVNWQESISKEFNYTLPNSFNLTDKVAYKWVWHIRKAELSYKKQMQSLPGLIRCFARQALGELHITVANGLIKTLGLEELVDLSDDTFENSKKLHVMLDKAFDHLSTIYLLLFQKKNNLLAGYELIKLFAQTHRNDFAAPTSEEKINFDVCEIAFALIETHKFCIPEIQKYIEDILDGTATKEHKIRKEYILDEIVVKKLTENYSQKNISLQQILQLPQKDLKLLLNVYLPMLIRESKEEEQKTNYINLEKDIRSAITEDYLPLDTNIKQGISKKDFFSFLGMQVYVPIDYSSSESDGEDFEDDGTESSAPTSGP